MKYCRFQLNDQPHYGLVESVAGVERITRLLLSPPEGASEELEDLPTKRMDHLSLTEAALLAPVRPSKLFVSDATTVTTPPNWVTKFPPNR